MKPSMRPKCSMSIDGTDLPSRSISVANPMPARSITTESVASASIWALSRKNPTLDPNLAPYVKSVSSADVGDDGTGSVLI